jgi:Flp pilus assembly protein TadD
MLLSENSTEAARELLNETPAAQKPRLEVRLALARVEFQKGDFAASEQDLLAMNRQYPGSSDVLSSLGIVYLQKHDWKMAQAVLDRALKINPKDPVAIEYLAAVYVGLNQASAGETLYSKMVASDPASSAVALGLAHLRIAQGRDPEAEKGIRAYLAVAPKDTDAMKLLADLRFRQKDYAAAEAISRQVIQGNPDDPSGYMAMASLFEARKQPKEAIAQYREVLKRGDNPIAANNLAWLLAEGGGNIDEALALAQKSKEKHSDDPAFADTLGWIYLKKGNVSLALGEFRDAVKRDPKNQEIRYHMGLAQWRSGKLHDAKASLEIALAGNPTFPAVGNARQILADVNDKLR